MEKKHFGVAFHFVAVRMRAQVMMLKMEVNTSVTQAVATIFLAMFTMCIVCVCECRHDDTYQILPKEEKFPRSTSATSVVWITHSIEWTSKYDVQHDLRSTSFACLLTRLPSFHRQYSIENIFAFHSLLCYFLRRYSAFSMRFLNLFFKTFFVARKSIVDNSYL